MSDKFKVIDFNTFEKMQQSSSGITASNVSKIRNSKYKRMTASNGFNLMQFVKTTPRGKKSKNKKKVKTIKRVIDTPIVKKHRGKKRENGDKKKPSRLKKSILQYRQKKREQRQMEEQLQKLEFDFKVMKVDNTSDKKGIVHSLHSSSFREYCNCCTTPYLKKFCEQLLRELNYYQRRAYAQNAIKARAHKRFVIGFRQVQAHLHINKIKLVIIATDCEHNEGEVSLDETISRIKNVCFDQNVPVVFAFRRREMAYILYKKASISCVGILDYDGARDIFGQLIEALKIAREMYNTLLLNR